MNPKVFFSLGAVAIVSLIAAGAVHGVSRTWGGGQGDTLIVPGLADRLGEAARIEVRQASKSLDIVRKGERWVFENRDGYAADPARVRGVLIGLGELRRHEPKTRKKELYPHIEVEDPNGEGTSSRGLTIKSEDGDALAELIVGKTRSRVLGATKGGVYVRLADDEQSWLAAGELDVSADVTDWLDTRIMKVSVEAVAEVTASRGITFPLRLIRLAGENRGFVVESLPEKMTAKSEFALQNEVRKITAVSFDDVRAAVGTGAPDARMTLATTSGLELKFELRQAADGGSWLRISATGDGDQARSIAREMTERFSGYEFHLEPDVSEDFMLTLADVVDIEAS